MCDESPYDSEHILQILTKSRQLSKNITVVCIGPYHQKSYDNLLRYGATKVITYRQRADLNYKEYSQIANEIISDNMPKLVLYPASTFGKIVAATLSTRFEAGLTADCIELEMVDGEIYFSRAAISDSIVAKIKCINCDISMCTIKKDVFLKQESKEGIKGIIEEYHSELIEDPIDYQLLEREVEEVEEEVDISQYTTVFCIGRGVNSIALRDRIYKLAQICGAGVIGTRAAVEEKLVNKDIQVGQSGKSISPKIYISFGVSGASQHMVGIKNAKVVIAINNNENAPIFNYADYAIVQDVERVVEEMEKQLIG